jgi:PKHD-type hydroxylase
MLVRVPSVLNAERLAECRRLLSAGPWIDGGASAGVLAAHAKHNREIDQRDPMAQKLGEIVVASMMASAPFQAAALPVRISPPSFSRYEGGQAYGFHNDAAILEFNVSGSRLLVRTDLAATLFLNEPGDYEGGELMVEDNFGLTKIKLAAGDMVLYPASSLHRVSPVTKGTRLVSFLWIQSLVRDDSHRRMLYDLDMTIQQLRRDTPGNAAELKLVNLYHNLLRLWSET